MQKILLVDNHDSFTYNLAQLVQTSGLVDLAVARPWQVSRHEINDFDGIIFSPGPDLPLKGDCMHTLLHDHGHRKKILGICLGHQAIALYFGGSLQQKNRPSHGSVANILLHQQPAIFSGLPKTITGALYHSWMVSPNLPQSLEVIARDEEGNIMGLRHAWLNITGLQFHPEAYRSSHGRDIIANWLRH